MTTPNGIHPATDETEADEPPPRRRTPRSHHVIGAVLLGVLVLVGIGMATSDGGNDLQASDASFQASPGGRIEVRFTVANLGDGPTTASCDLRTYDGDGVLMGGDQVDGLTIAAGSEEHVRTVIGGDPARVARVSVEC